MNNIFKIFSGSYSNGRDWVINQSLYRHVDLNDLDDTKVLKYLQYTIEVLHYTQGYDYALERAIEKNFYQSVSYLLSKGAKLNRSIKITNEKMLLAIKQGLQLRTEEINPYIQELKPFIIDDVVNAITDYL